MKNFIFDIDGTLIDTASLDRVTMQQALAENGYDFTFEQLRFAFGMPGRIALVQLGVQDILPVMARWEGLLYSRLDEIPIYDGVTQALTALRAMGKKCGIVTSRSRSQFERGFSPIGMDGYFDEIVCADEVENPKPAPDELVECIRRLGGTAAESVYIGDSRYDMQCAASAGVKSALALWGADDPDSLAADWRLAKPEELLTLGAR